MMLNCLGQDLGVTVTLNLLKSDCTSSIFCHSQAENYHMLVLIRSKNETVEYFASVFLQILLEIFWSRGHKGNVWRKYYVCSVRCVMHIFEPTVTSFLCPSKYAQVEICWIKLWHLLEQILQLT